MDTATPRPTPRSEHTGRIAAKLDRLHAAMASRPGFGHSTDTSMSELVGGMRCSTREGSFQIESDLPPALGGDRAAPTPGALVRAALGACLVMGYRLQAAERGIELTSVRVTVEAESELRGMLDPSADVPPGYTGLRYHVDIESSAPVHEIERVIERGDQLSPVLDALTRPNSIVRTVSIERVA